MWIDFEEKIIQGWRNKKGLRASLTKLKHKVIARELVRANPTIYSRLGYKFFCDENVTAMAVKQKKIMYDYIHEFLRDKPKIIKTLNSHEDRKRKLKSKRTIDFNKISFYP